MNCRARQKGYCHSSLHFVFIFVSTHLITLRHFSCCLAIAYLPDDSGNLKITNLDRLIFTKNGEFTI